MYLSRYPLRYFLYSCWWLLAIGFSLCTQQARAHQWELNKGKPFASCFVVDKHGNVLMVKDKATGKYHLPGGAIEELSEEDTALMHMVSDTGFNAHIGYKIDQLVNHAIFSCGLLTPKDFFHYPKW